MSVSEQAALKLQAAQQTYADATEAFGNRLETRKATNRPDQGKELIARTKALDILNGARIAMQHSVDDQSQATLDAQRAQNDAKVKLDVLNGDADNQLAAAIARADLRVFGHRMLLMPPLLGIARWLFVRRRNSTCWAFV